MGIIREFLKEKAGVQDPDNYIVLNMASDSVKADAAIVQVAYMLKGVLYNEYVLGGNVRGNMQYTGISINSYYAEAVLPEVVENKLVGLMQENNISYIVYNNDWWNRKLIAGNSWVGLKEYMNYKPCLAISDYESVRRSFGETLASFKGPLKDICKLVSKKASSGYRCPLNTNYEDRLGEEYDCKMGPYTVAEQNTVMMDEILKDILGRTSDEEVYIPGRKVMT